MDGGDDMRQSVRRHLPTPASARLRAPGLQQRETLMPSLIPKHVLRGKEDPGLVRPEAHPYIALAVAV